MELQLLWRLGAVLVLWTGLMLVGLGVGGISGGRCKSGALIHGKVDHSQILKPPPPRPPCRDWERLQLVHDYISIDHFFGPALLQADAPGLLRLRPRRLSHASYRGYQHHYRPVSLGPDNLIFANPIGLKLGFTLGVGGFFTATFLLLSNAQFICYTNPRIFLLEKIAMFLGIVLDLSGGALCAIWGCFFHVDVRTVLGPDASVLCIGWLIGGVLLVSTAVLQTVDLILTLSTKPIPEPSQRRVDDRAKDRGKKNRDRAGDDQRSERTEQKKIGWQSTRAPPPGMDDDFYTRYEDYKSQRKAEEKAAKSILQDDVQPKKKGRKKGGGRKKEEATELEAKSVKVNGASVMSRAAETKTLADNKVSMDTQLTASRKKTNRNPPHTVATAATPVPVSLAAPTANSSQA